MTSLSPSSNLQSPQLARTGIVPQPLTTFVGRETEIAKAREILARDEIRLLTLTGPGGVGKTRLALKAAENPGGLPDGVWFVPLASIRDPVLVPTAIANALGAAQRPNRNIEHDLVDHLRHRKLLLILDNFEQIVDAGPLLADLLSACPGLKVMVTSRSILRISGEHVFPVPPLDVPARHQQPRLDDVRRSPSVSLFVERARASDSRFDLTTHNATAIIEICRRLDGLPLAIELAAARVNVFSPADLLHRLVTRLSILTSGALDQPFRLRSLPASMAWSYELLSPHEQTLFRQLSVFAGPWTLDIAEAVIQGVNDGFDLSVLDGVSSLIGKNLIQRQVAPDGVSQYAMLETTREFARWQMELNNEAGRVRDAHMTIFLAIATEGEAHLVRNVDPAWLDRLEANHENFRGALAWAFDTERSTTETSRGVKLAGALWLFWYYRGHLTEGRHWLELALASSRDKPDAARATALLGLGTMLHYQGEKVRARTLLTEGVALSRHLNDRWLTALLVTACGNLAEDEGNYDEASAHFNEAKVLFAEAGDNVNVAVTLYHLGVVAFGQGNLDLSLARCQEALELARQSDDPWTTAGSLAYLGLVRCARGELEDASLALGEALAIYSRIESPERIAEVLRRVAIVAKAREHYSTAVRLLAAAQSLGESIGVHQELPELDIYERAISELRHVLSTDEYTALWRAGGKMSMHEAIAEAESMVNVDARNSTSAASEQNDSSATSGVQLSARELEVLRLLVNGHTDREIADLLFISRRTASTHIAHIYNKLGVSSRAAVAAYAIRNGLV